MAELSVQIVLDRKQYDEVIKQIKATAQKPLELKVKTTGLDGLKKITDNLIKYEQARAKSQAADNAAAKAQAQLINAQARQAKTENDLLIAREKTAQATQKTTQEEAKLAKEKEKTSQATQKTAQEEAKLAQQHEKTTQATIKLGQEYEKTSQAQASQAKSDNELAKAKEKTAQATEKTTQEALKLEEQYEKTIQATEKTRQKELDLENQYSKSTATGKKYNQFLSSLGKTFSLSQIATTAFMMAINKLRSAFNEALGTIKDVDTAISHYRQVTGESAEQAQVLADKAYSVASAFGQSADSYVETVASYARAGYKAQADELAELSMKTQIAGQTTAEIADQFILTMDAAYKYGGSVSKLTKILDYASYIDNNYATTVEKIATGMGIVAPLAAQVHVSEEQLVASIATITAATQRSGAETARALRSLYLSILGDTKTEVEEGVTVTEEAVTDMGNLLKEYAPEAVKAAQATGQIINPMEAISALSSAMKDGLLTETQLMEKLSSLGGKLRVSQLVALVSNFDKYNEMLAKTGESVGSADAKVSVALESWEFKLNILKNTFAEFVARTLNANTFKSFLDGLSNAIRLIGDLGNALRILLTTLLTIKGLKLSIALINASKSLEGTTGLVKLLASSNSELAKSFGAVGGAVTAMISAVMIATSALVMYDNQLYETKKAEAEAAKEAADNSSAQAETISELYENYEYMKIAYQRGKVSKDKYEEATKSLTDALGLEGEAAKKTREELEQLAIAEMEKALSDQKVAIEKQKVLALQTIQKTYDDAGWTGYNNRIATGVTGETEAERFQSLLDNYARAKRIVKELNEEIESGGNGTRPVSALIADKERWESEIGAFSGVIEDYYKRLQKVNQLRDDIAKTRKDMSDEEYAEKTKELAKAEKELQDSLEGVADKADEAKTAIEKLKEATKVDKADDFKTVAKTYESAIADIQNGFKNSNNVNALAEILFSPEQIAQMKLRGIEVADIIASDFFKEWFTYEGEFTGGEDSGALALWHMFDNYTDDAGNIVKNNGDIVASFQEVDGTLSANVESFEALSDALSERGVTVGAEMLKILFQALENYGDTTKTRAEELREIAKAAGALKANGTIDLKILAENLDLTEEEIANLKDEIDEFNGKTFRAKIDADTSAAMRKMGDAYGLATRLQGTYSVKVELTDNATAKLAALQGQLSTATSKTYNLNAKVNVRQTMAEGGKAKGGLTLVNEEGAELIKEGDTARIAGNGKPTLTWLQSGATVYTASQTKAMLGGYDTEALFDRINAYSLGVNNVGRWTGNNSSSNNSSSNNTSNTPAKYTYTPPTANNTPATVTNDGDNTTDETLENLKKIVELRKSELALSQAYGESVEKQVKAHQNVQKALKDQIDYLISIGGDQTEINNLTVEWYNKYQDIADVQSGGKSSIVSLLKSEYELLESQGASTETLVAKYRQIQAAIKAEADYLEQVNGDQETINGLRTEYYNINQSIQKLYDADAKRIETERKEAENKRKQDIEDYIDKLKDTVDLRKSELSLLEAKGASDKEQIAKLKQIRSAIQAQINYYQKIGGYEKEINDLKTEQYQIDKSIQTINDSAIESEKNRLAGIVNLRKSELQVLKSQDATVKNQIQKQRQIQASLQAQINYLKSIGAEQAEINGLITDYYNITSNIEALENSLLSDLEKAVNQKIKDLNEERDAELDKIKEQINKLKEAKEVQDEQLELEEKRFAIEEARDKLQKAQNERNIRYYNAATGQWEWGANRKNIQSAEEALQKAIDALQEYTDKKAFDAKIAALEQKEDEITNRYEKLTDKWEKVLGVLEEPVITIAQALKNIANNATKGMASDIAALNAVLKPLGYSISTANLYDSGGVLAGMGGIKATAYDEMVIPPDLTRKMLSPLATSTFSDRMQELSYLYGAGNYKNLAGIATTTIGNQYNGDRYNFGNISLSREQAKSMTVYDLVQQSRNLRAYSSAI